jgi:hypothetical protein
MTLKLLLKMATIVQVIRLLSTFLTVGKISWGVCPLQVFKSYAIVLSKDEANPSGAPYSVPFRL